MQEREKDFADKEKETIDKFLANNKQVFQRIKDGQLNYQQTYDFYQKLQNEKEKERKMFEESFINKKYNEKLFEMEMKNQED